MQDAEHDKDLQNMFEILRTYNMNINANKCVFGVRSGKFLGFMINSWEIEANLGKVKAVLGMKPPRNIKEVQ